MFMFANDCPFFPRTASRNTRVAFCLGTACLYEARFTLGYRRIMANEIRRASSPSFVSEDVDLSGSPAKPELDEINDHPD